MPSHVFSVWTNFTFSEDSWHRNRGILYPSQSHEDDNTMPQLQKLHKRHCPEARIRRLRYAKKMSYVCHFVHQFSTYLWTQILVHIQRDIRLVCVASWIASFTFYFHDFSDQAGRPKCPVDPFYIVPDKCKCVDFQVLKLQEIPESVPNGEMPRHMQLYCDR